VRNRRFEIEGVDVTATATALLDALAARGRDGSWSAIHGPFVLVETRLAVIDLSDEGVYPMANESGNVHLLFNGRAAAPSRPATAMEAAPI
jgi:asparagine synthetase B (glutamine-hydrolysing)